MPKRSSNAKRPRDVNELAYAIVQESTAEKPEQELSPGVLEKNPAAVALGRLGGLNGGKARAEKLTPEQRREIVRRAAQRQWGKTEPR